MSTKIFNQCVTENRFNYTNVVAFSELQFVEAIHHEVVHNGNTNMVKILKGITDAIKQYYEVKDSHTYEYWTSMGYIKKRGAKPESKDAQGKALFTRRQVLAYDEQKANYFYS